MSSIISSSSSSSSIESSLLLSGHEKALRLYALFRGCSDAYLAPCVNQALDIIIDAYRLFGVHKVCCSYNGGKDAVVILYLLLAAHASYVHDDIKDNMDRRINDNEDDDEGTDGKGKSGKLGRQSLYPDVVYFQPTTGEFPEILSHISMIEEEFGLSLTRYDGSIMTGLQTHLQKIEASVSPAAFILGTRNGDPDAANQQYFSPSSTWMKGPAFMRVNPIITWEYGHVWHFLRLFRLPYCRLYDLGYTSLGKTTDSLRNHALRKPANIEEDCSATTDCSVPTSDSVFSFTPTESSASRANDCQQLVVSEEVDKYWPAFFLTDWSLERAGRRSSSVQTIASVPMNILQNAESKIVDSVYRIAIIIAMDHEDLQQLFSTELNRWEELGSIETSRFPPSPAAASVVSLGVADSFQLAHLLEDVLRIVPVELVIRALSLFELQKWSDEKLRK